MRKVRMNHSGISRRDFLKRTGAGVAAVALGGTIAPRPAFAALVGNVPAWKMIYCWNNPFGGLDPHEEATRIIVDEAADIWLSNEKMNGIFTADVHGWRFCDVGMGQELYPMWRE